RQRRGLPRRRRLVLLVPVAVGGPQPLERRLHAPLDLGDAGVGVEVVDLALQPADAVLGLDRVDLTLQFRDPLAAVLLEVPKLGFGLVEPPREASGLQLFLELADGLLVVLDLPVDAGELRLVRAPAFGFEAADRALMAADLPLQAALLALDRAHLAPEAALFALDRADLALKRADLALERTDLSLQAADLALDAADLAIAGDHFERVLEPGPGGVVHGLDDAVPRPSIARALGLRRHQHALRVSPPTGLHENRRALRQVPDRAALCVETDAAAHPRAQPPAVP